MVMRTKTLFDQAISGEAISEILNFQEQDARFLIQCDGAGVILYVEESIDQTMWSPMCDSNTLLEYYAVNGQIAIKDNYFMGKYMRLRAVGSGNLKALIGYKTKP
jgi:hypothetical protein